MPVWFELPRKYKLSRSSSCVRYATNPCAVALVAAVVLITALSSGSPSYPPRKLGRPPAPSRPCPSIETPFRPGSRSPCLRPAARIRASDTFLVPAVTTIWLAVEIVAHGSSTVAFAVEIVRFDPIDRAPGKIPRIARPAIARAQRAQAGLQLGPEIRSRKLIHLVCAAQRAIRHQRRITPPARQISRRRRPTAFHSSASSPRSKPCTRRCPSAGFRQRTSYSVRRSGSPRAAVSHVPAALTLAVVVDEHPTPPCVTVTVPIAPLLFTLP